MDSPVFTNKALVLIGQLGIAEALVLEVFNKGAIQKWTNGVGFNSVKKYTGYEIGVAWFRDQKGVYRITSVWKRENRR